MITNYYTNFHKLHLYFFSISKQKMHSSSCNNKIGKFLMEEGKLSMNSAVDIRGI